MKSVRNHYDEFLAPVYSWILGDFDNACQGNVKLFADMDLSPSQSALAIDLGSGPGCQSLPLAERGFRVVAIDFCQELLDELTRRSGDRQISTVCDDLLNFDKYLDDAPELIVCMGDTLVHLPDVATVATLLDKVCAALTPGGIFIYGIRDYVSHEPGGAQRFVPVRADDEQIFTCFLDYRADTVHVHDVLYTKRDGTWQLSISDYLKLRLDTVTVNQQLVANGMQILREETVKGMLQVVARRPATA